MTETTVNVPLLRKAVEWAEAEAEKPYIMREWHQPSWIATPDMAYSIEDSTTKAPECGTCYCIAGYTVAMTLAEGETIQKNGDRIYNEDGVEVDIVLDRAMKVLGIKPRRDTFGDVQLPALFRGSNTIEDVRKCAEELAGERL